MFKVNNKDIRTTPWVVLRKSRYEFHQKNVLSSVKMGELAINILT